MKQIINLIPAEVLKEMEEIQILGGTGVDDTHVYAVHSCSPNIYCDGANCVAECACDIKKDPDEEQP